MADIQPFKASRYAAKFEGELDQLLTPPYDVISPDMQEELYQRHSYNLVRVDFAMEIPNDDEKTNRYTRAARMWDFWQEEGAIVADPNPAIYVYEQEFEIAGLGRKRRRGFFAAVKLKDFSEGGVRAHEHTFAGPKADRLNLMRATGANMSPIFCVYDDSARVADKALAAAIQGKKPVETTIDDVVHRLWIVDGPAVVASVTQAMKPHELFIADGHHRYETSLNYRNEMREKTGQKDGKQPFDYTLIFMANIHDEGLVILPTHRVFSSAALPNFDPGPALQKLTGAFDTTPLDVDIADENKAAAAITAKLAEAGKRSVSFGLVMPGRKPFLISLRPGADPTRLIPGEDKIPALKKLDVTILHSFIIHKLWLDSPATELDDAHVSYVKEAAEAVRMVREGGQAAAFILNPTRVDQVMQIAGAGARMPHKSTYFYPKIITGMVIRDMKRQ